MILLNVKDCERYAPYLSENLCVALRYLATTDFTKLAKGEYEVKGRDVFARVNEYVPGSIAEHKAERHFQYIDVQYLARGEEMLGYAPLTGEEVPITQADPRDDVVFFENVQGERFTHLGVGTIAILFPWELHRPGCQTSEKPELVKKIVVKVKA